VLNKDDLHFFAAEVANGVLLFVFWCFIGGFQMILFGQSGCLCRILCVCVEFFAFLPADRGFASMFSVLRTTYTIRAMTGFVCVEHW
jgi:hypothetical protein